MARDRNIPPDTGETGSDELDPQSPDMQQEQPPLMGRRQDNEGTTTDPMIKNKAS